MMRGGAERAQLHRYADAIAMWCSRFDTQEIALELKLPEHQVARWVSNFREQMRARG